MIDRKARLVLESYIITMYAEHDKDGIKVLLDLYKQLIGEPFDLSAAIQRKWGVRK